MYSKKLDFWNTLKIWNLTLVKPTQPHPHATPHPHTHTHTHPSHTPTPHTHTHTPTSPPTPNHPPPHPHHPSHMVITHKHARTHTHPSYKVLKNKVDVITMNYSVCLFRRCNQALKMLTGLNEDTSGIQESYDGWIAFAMMYCPNLNRLQHLKIHHIQVSGPTHITDIIEIPPPLTTPLHTPTHHNHHTHTLTHTPL